MQPGAKKISLFLLDHQAIFRHGLSKRLSQEEDFAVLGEAGTVKETVSALEKATPDLLLLDLQLSGAEGLRLLRKMKRLCPATRTIVLTDSEDEKDVLEAMRLGAQGYVLKNSPTGLILKSIRRVAQGEIWLASRHLQMVLRAFRSYAHRSRGPTPPAVSPREKQIIRLVISGCKNREIARQLSISEKTVKNHLSNIFDKLGVNDRLELALYAFERKLLEE